MRPLLVIAAVCMSLAPGFGQGDADQNALIEKYRKDLETNPSSSLLHFRIGEIYFQQKNYQGAANEFREALNRDLQPNSIEVEAHLNLSAIFTVTGQLDRAQNENRLAMEAIGRNQAQPSLPFPLPEVYTIPAAAAAPQLLEKTDPEYSQEARLAGLEGAVLLRGTITEQGLARDMRVTGSLGFGLDEKALQAIQQWRFSPGTLDGRPVPFEMTVPVDFLLPDKQSRWHMIRAEFTPPQGASRPQFSKALYPYGAGISTYATEEGLVISAIGRQATVRVAFDVDEDGNPVNLRVLTASHPIWGPEALALVRTWKFNPGMKSGTPVAVPCTLELIWGRTNLTTKALEWAATEMHTSSVRSAPVPVHDFRSPAVIFQAPDPPYTEEARKAGLQGTVRISLVVGSDGTPQNLRVMSPLGLGLDENAIEAVSHWRFSPALVNGQPAAIRTVVEVNFHLPE